MPLFRYVKSIKMRDPAMKSYLQILLFNNSVKIMFWYRIANFLYRTKFKYISYFIMNRVKRKTGAEVHPASTIGKFLLIDHGVGVVIGETSIIGNNCTIYQGVTLGGTGKEQGKRHPTIGDNVMIGAGAKVLGNIYVGDNVKVGANAVVLENITSSNTVVGCKGKVVKR